MNGNEGGSYEKECPPAIAYFGGRRPGFPAGRCVVYTAYGERRIMAAGNKGGKHRQTPREEARPGREGQYI